VSDTVTPRSFSEVASALAGAAAQGRPVRVSGGGTKLGWGGQTPAQALKLHTTHLNRVIVHADGATATLGAGTPMVRAQSFLARSGHMFAVDPQLGLGREPVATVGGVVSTADSGPLSHRYGPVREQIVGVTVALSDGTVVRTGPRIAAEEDGYELATLVTGAYGTLGVVLAVDVRLQPLLGRTATALGATAEPAVLRDAVMSLGRAHPALQALDVAWRGGQGGLLAQMAGDDASERAEAAADTMRLAGLAQTTVRTDDAGLWARQRAGQRSGERALLRVHSRPGALGAVLEIADMAEATLVGRAALGISYLTLNVNQVAAVRGQLPGDASAVMLDLPTSARGAVDPWAQPDGPELELMRRIKGQFDPADICNPGIFVGRI
jgi:glycolate oxidase FAD binding subunit